MITLTREEAQQVLDAMEAMQTYTRAERKGLRIFDEAIETLRARLEQPEPEPVAWHEPGAYGNVTVHKDWAKENGWLPLYKEQNT